MNRLLFFVLAVIPAIAHSQTRITALNNYVEYANRSAAEEGSVFGSIVSYSQRLHMYQASKYVAPPRYECPVSPEEFYYTKALKEGAVVNDGGLLANRTKALHAAAGVIDTKCKALDTYHKLQDYKQDDFKQAVVLLGELQAAFKAYRDRQTELANGLETEWKKQPGAASGAATADRMMKKEIARERAFLDLWSYNLNEDIHTGWPIDKLPASIAETDQAVTLFTQAKPALEYPAVSMYGSFKEALESVLSSKRSSLDGYNHEAKQSDKHSNEAYRDLINYFNGALIADQNTFIRFALPNGYNGLGSISYVPVFEQRSAALAETITIVPFQNITRVPVTIAPQAAVIPAATAAVLNNYIELLNEYLRQLESMTRGLRTLNADAAYLKAASTFKGKGGLNYSNSDFKMPLSDFQKATSNTSAATPWRTTLNDQAKVLMNILTEMDQIASVLDQETEARRYEKDSITHVYALLEREVVLANLAFDKREQLYHDVRTVFESYGKPTGSWAKSSAVMLGLVDEEKIQLFKARDYINGDTTSVPDGARLEVLLRDALSNEYANLKGIENLGSSNGNDPYTPYEDLPATARTFSKEVKEIKKKSRSHEYDGPYHGYQYLYNVAVEHYNKFADLAKISVLRNITEPGLFVMEYPKKKKERVTEVNEQPVIAQTTVSDPVAPTESPAEEPVVVTNEPQKRQKPERVKKQTRRGDVQPAGSPAEGRVIHDTIKVTDIIRIETRRSDTVYIEKHDTVYRDGGSDRMLSLEGYASNNLVFLLDVSGSMNTGQKLPLLKKSMLLLLKILRAEDNVSIVVYSGKARAVLPPTSAKEQDRIKKVIESLRSDGATDGNAGIRMAYKTADGSYIRGGNNRIVLATDGEFPVSDETLAMISKFARQDIFLSVFNFGNSSAAAQSLKKLATLGKGNFEAITAKNSDVKLIMEAKAKKR